MIPEPKFFDGEAVTAALGWLPLIEAIEAVVLADGAESPERTVHPVPDTSGSAVLLLKPGWIGGDVIAVKAVTFFPDNGSLDRPTINAGVLLFDGTDGTFLGACDGNVLTARRTAAASATAAKRLARSDASHLLVVGTGTLAPCVAQAHSAVRPIERIQIWGRDAEKAAAVVAELGALGLAATVAHELDGAVEQADVISCVTGATAPLVRGRLLKPGAHLDLIGSFTPGMRESDDDAVRRASVFVDTRADGVIAGDLAQPLADGVITTSDILADLRALVAGEHPGRTDDDEITLYKSAGFALQDVAAAKLVFADGA